MDVIESICSKNEAFVSNENFSGVKKVIVDNYSDDVHFVYELLQNADDVSASEISFELEKDRLLVTHNGTPFTEENLKAICSISKGTKAGDYTKIGRFGIGFKSVFVYTDAPQIYSGDYSFEIRDLVMPYKIPAYESLNRQETLFIIPFNATRTKKTAYNNICRKLQALTDEALLFLNHISHISIKIWLDDGTTNNIRIIKEIIESSSLENDEIIQKIRVILDDDLYEKQDCNYWLLTKNNIELLDSEDDDDDIHVYNQSVKIAFTEYNGLLCPCSEFEDENYENLFVFFPTRIPSNCEFILHAPFVTKSSRDTIALNNDANTTLQEHLGLLIADSICVFLNRKMLDLELIDALYFNEHKSDVMWQTFEKRLVELIESGEAMIPCEKETSKSEFSVLFTKESRIITYKLIELLGLEWISDYYDLFEDFGLCHLEEDCRYYQFLKTHFECKELVLNEIVSSLDAVYYQNHTAQWIVDFINLFVVRNNYGYYDIKIENIKKYPLVRRSDGTHTYCNRTERLFINDHSLDDIVVSDQAARYLYEHVYNIKEYSLELLDARDAIPKIREMDIDSCFDDYSEQLSKIILAIETKKLTLDDIKNEPIMLVQNQKNGVKRKAIPSCSRIGKWERTNGIFDLYVLLKDVDINLLDERYATRFASAKLKLLGCIDGLDYEEVNTHSYFKSLGSIPYQVYGYNKYVRALPFKASNRQFRPLQQIKQLPAILDAPMTLEKSILILRLAKEFDNQIIDWIEWASRADFNSNSSWYGTGKKYSAFGQLLHSRAWLYNKEMELVSPSNIEEENLATEYTKYVTADIAEKLGMRQTHSTMIESLLSQLNSSGYYAIPLDEKEEYEEFLRLRQEQNNKQDGIESDIAYRNNDVSDDDSSAASSKEYDDKRSTDYNNRKSTGNKIVDKVISLIHEDKTELDIDSSNFNVLDDEDEDEYTRATVDYAEQVKKKEMTLASELNALKRKDELQTLACNATKYSYLWFKALLEMESINSGESNSNKKSVSIKFGKVDVVPGKKLEIDLKQPDSHIPSFLEETINVALYFYCDGKEYRIEIDGASVKSYVLRVKLNKQVDISHIDLRRTTAKVEASSPEFLLDTLREQFDALGYSDDYDLRANLSDNIEFVFGPPGTGKTTYLASNIILPLMREYQECKILVLTPTNKAADVLVKRIMEVSGSDISYETWLVRFGATIDEMVEQSAVYYNKQYDINRCTKNVTVTTIARFPYDFFVPHKGAVQFLREVDWDYIVIDEASMIPIANIVYPLYKKQPEKFIIAGDPFQIEPITSISLWKDENIYKMVKLESFVEPHTIPHQYKVVNLTTQYRSIPEIGDIFSKFAYGGILNHARSTESQKQLNAGNDLGIETLNIIKFPVKKYESIYRSKRLNRSSYHIYSALFTYEYVKYLSGIISTKNPHENYTIGIIAPYRAEADLIYRLVSSEKNDKNVEIQVGTIHGFQGDECDIVVAVFNAPPGISASDDMFLNKKTIMNVSISRAKDYLFIIMPDDNTENVSNLRLVKTIERLIKDTDVWNEFDSHDLEELMFDDSNYIENNSFSTGHQNVNVYGLPENLYEIRAEETAVDIQVHKTTVDSTGHQKKELSILDVPDELRDDADIYIVDGDIRGEYYIAPYEGKLSEYTTKPMSEMFFILEKEGQEKQLQVKVDENGKIIYLAKQHYKSYRDILAVSATLKIKYKLY